MLERTGVYARFIGSYILANLQGARGYLQSSSMGYPSLGADLAQPRW